jgi:hypothetical protein
MSRALDVMDTLREERDALRTQVEELKAHVERLLTLKREAVLAFSAAAKDTERVEAKLAAVVEILRAGATDLSLRVDDALRAALAAARDQPTHAFEPCREGDGGDDPAHNFTCALLCVHCGLTRERHSTRSYQDPVDEADDALEASQRPFVEITREDLARVFEPGSCGNPACPACGEPARDQPTQETLLSAGFEPPATLLPTQDKLPLGHEFREWARPGANRDAGKCGVCCRPESAHRPEPHLCGPMGVGCIHNQPTQDKGEKADADD